MPTYNPDHVEYNIASARIHVRLDDGKLLPAYWAHPTLTAKFPGIALIHDWWGLTDSVRRMANQLAQVGHYVIAPDLFNGSVATSHAEALNLLDKLGDGGYARVNAVLSVLERHHQCNGYVGVVGFGLGGSLAFEAAIMRDDLEAAVAYGGFPQRYFGYFHRSNTPILALYGTREQYIPPEVIEKLRTELAANPRGLPHEVVMLDNLDHHLLKDIISPQEDIQIRKGWHKTLDFLDNLLQGPNRPPDRRKR